MKRLTEYISELLHSQIDPNMCRDLADVRPPVDKQSITSKNDIIHVEFEYKDKIYKYDIKYNDLIFITLKRYFNTFIACSNIVLYKNLFTVLEAVN